MKKLIILLVVFIGSSNFSNSQTLSPVVFPTAGGFLSGGGNTLSFTMGETFHTTLQSGGLVLTEGEQQPYIELKLLNLKVFIEGFYSGSGLMDNSGAGGCLYVNGLSANATDVDTVTVSLMDGTTKAFVAAATNILQTDGSLILKFNDPVLLGGSYYIKVNHRNALETWSATPMVFASNNTFDFSTAATQAYGSNMVDVGTQAGEPATWAFYSGDISDSTSASVGMQDGLIQMQDYLDMETGVSNFLSGYKVEDLTGDGLVETADFSLMENNVAGGVVVIHP
jgi:hypothetical protein